jgi:hypothetical protein
LIVSSALMLTSDPAESRLGNSNFEDARNRAGYTMLAPGALIAAGGVAMLTVGLVRERRVRVGAAVNTGSAYLSASGRF